VNKFLDDAILIAIILSTFIGFLV